jgi:hypothetical protein
MTDPYGQNQPQYPGGFNPYGHSPYGQNPYGPQGFQPPRTEPMAIVSLILALAGPFVACGIACPVGAILGHVALRKIRNDPQLDGEGLAKWGIAVGWIFTGLGLIAIAAWAILVVVAINHPSSY